MGEPDRPKRVPFWGQRHGSRAPIVNRLAKRLSGVDFELALEERSLRRGATIEGTLRVTHRRGQRKRIEVGLICTESYDIETTSTVDDRIERTRTTKRAKAYEKWLPFDEVQDVHAVSLTIPEHSPYTYHGKALSFDWQVRAVRRSALRPDAAEHWEVTVLP